MLSAEAVEFKGTTRFQIIRRLGEGGMGVVYEAFDRERQSRVALKTVLGRGGEELLRLKNEFRALQDLQHPNLVTLHELREAAGHWFFTMELVEGVTFLDYVRPRGEGAPPPPPASSEAGITASAETWRASPAQRMWDAAVAPASPALDLGRLRAALAQVARGLTALHDAGKLHRDIKPSNIMVTPAGRVVILDLGLVTGLARADQTAQSAILHPVGTAAYMAPEQAASQHVGPPADWYGVGVVLYEALTGRVPFSGETLKVMLDKQRGEPPPPRELVPDLPTDLDELCVALLRFDPEARPAGSEVLKRLGVTAAPGPAPSTRRSSTGQAPCFVGRVAELAALEEAFAAAQRGGAVVVLVEGESGVGKTTLVRSFGERLASRGVVTLTGRCFERESVPYKGVDGVIDSLSRYMARLPAEESAALLPRAAALLGQVFPVLRRVKAVADAPGLHVDLPYDPPELRSRLFAAVRELIGRLADRHPLVVVVDDLQWADADSLALLAEVLRPPEAPQLLAVGLLRSGTELAAAGGMETLAALGGGARRLEVGRLPAADARELAQLLLQRVAPERQESAASIAAEAEGHPLFIDELVRHAAAQEGAAPTAFKLEEALRARIARLGPTERLVLDLVAVAGTSLTQDVVARASSLSPSDFARALGLLRVSNLVQTTGMRGTDAVIAYHDRVRDSVVAALDPAKLKAYHRDLALALEAAGRDESEALAVHWREAGEPTRAAAHAVRAASGAAAAFAFDHAARLYRLALELRGEQDRSAQDLRVKLAEALTNAGRGGDAAAAYRAAAAGASPELALEYRRREAEQLLRAGHVDEGLAAVRRVLGELGMSMPSSPRRALASLLWRRALIRLRGLGYRERTASQISPADLTRIDTCWSLAHALAFVNTILAADFEARTLQLARKVGEPTRLLCNLAMEATYQSFRGAASERRVATLQQLMAEIARKHSSPALHAWEEACRAATEYYCGRFRHATERAERAETLLTTECAGVAWEIGTARVVHNWSLTHLGLIDKMSRRVRQQTAEALDRGDFQVATNLQLSILNAAWLVDDRVDLAREVARDALSRRSREASTQHWFDLTSQAQIGLYTGEGRAPYDRLQEMWPDLAGSVLLRIQIVRVEAWHMRARCALAAARATAAGSERDRLLHEAERDARRISREHVDYGEPWAQLIHAGVAAARGRLEAALAHLAVATEGFEAADMALYAAAARWRQGELRGGDAGRALIAEGVGYMTGQRIVAPERWLAMLTPGLGD